MIDEWVIVQALRILALPNDFAGFAIERDQERLAAGRENRPIVVDQRTLARVPRRHGRAEFLGQIDEPVALAGVRIEARNVAFRPQGDQIFLGHGGHGPRHAVVAFDIIGIAEPPDFLAVVEREAANGIGRGGAIVIVDVNPTGKDGRAGMAFAQFDLPDFLRSAARPPSRQGNARLADAVETLAAKSGPGARQVGGFAVEGLQLSDQRLGDLGIFALRRTIQPRHPGLQLLPRPHAGPKHQRDNASDGQKSGEYDAGKEAFHASSKGKPERHPFLWVVLHSIEMAMAGRKLCKISFPSSYPPQPPMSTRSQTIY